MHYDSAIDGFFRSATQFPDRPALEVGGDVHTYAELAARALALAADLETADPEAPLPVTAVLGHRSVGVFTGIIAALARGHAYLPLSTQLPAARNARVLDRVGCTTLVVDGGLTPYLADLLAQVRSPLTVVPTTAGALPGADPDGRHTMASPAPQVVPLPQPRRPHGPDAMAYLLFTSGSTGEPKGVMVAHRNVVEFVRATNENYDFSETDRFSQNFELTFDASVFDLFLPWSRGACLVCPSRKELLQAGRLITKKKLTVWYAVPSLGNQLRRSGALGPGRFPTLRTSIFIGEGLPVGIARAWQEAAPNSRLDNQYGPTEATVACTLHRVDPEQPEAGARQGLVPIGRSFGRTRAVVVDDHLDELPTGQEGELLVSGPQVALGYWGDEAQTARAFVPRGPAGEVFYRTGDRVVAEPDGRLCFLGRIDHQVKVNGYRVELGEIEAVLRRQPGVADVAAVGWPVTDVGISAIAVAVATDDAFDLAKARAAARATLPEYMTPQRWLILPHLPLNPNGKIDRAAVVQALEKETP